MSREKKKKMGVEILGGTHACIALSQSTHSLERSRGFPGVFKVKEER